MKMIVHDMQDSEQIRRLKANPNLDVIGDDTAIRHCTGCFGCWVRTPGTCVLKDAYLHLGERLAVCDELILISRCTYGGYSPFVCNVLNRTLSYVLPYFASRDGETHHEARYERQIKLSVYFYGDDLTEDERQTAQALVQANALNMNVVESRLSFYDNVGRLQEEGLAWA